MHCGPPELTKHWRATISAFVLISSLALIVIVNAHAPVRADTFYPWCMVYQEMTGAWSCAFASFEQCRASAAGGNGGTCIRNPAYQTPVKPVASPRGDGRPRR